MANSTPIDPRLRGRQSAGGFTPVDLQAGAANLRGPQPRKQTTPSPAPKGNSRGERNNNPGNLEDGAFARSQPGYAGSDGRFARFNTAADGEAAQVNLLRKNYKGMSVAQIIQKYAPVGDNSEESVRNYIGYVSSRAGLNPDAAVSDDHLHQVAAAMRAFETGKRGKIQFKPYAGQIRAASRGAAGTNASQGRMSVDGTAVPGATGVKGGPGNQYDRISGAGPIVEGKQRNVESKVLQAGAVLDDLLTQMGETQSQQIEAKQTQVNTVRVINEQMTAATHAMVERTAPVFQRQQEIADRLIENQNMSPLARGIRGLFDLNYNDRFLMGQMEKNNAIIEQVGQTYRKMNEYQTDAINQSETLYQLTTALPSLRLEHLGQQAKAAEMNLQHAQTDLDVTIQGVKNEVGLISAREAARNDLLSQMDSPTALALLGQAEQDPNGITVYNGVPISSQELRERAQQIERFNDSVEMSKMALANGRADLADKEAARMVEYATDAEIEQAIADGGVIQGVPIPAGLLSGEKLKRAQRAQQDAEIRELESTPMQAAQTAMAMANYSRSAALRAESIFGPNVVADEQIAFSNQIRDLSNRIRDGKAAGASDIEMGVLRQQLVKAKEGFDKAVQAKIKRMVGNDETGAAYVTSYMMGDSPTPSAAAEMMVHFAAKGGLPGAIHSSPFARTAMTQVMATIEELRGTKNPQTGRTYTDKQLLTAAKDAIANPNSPQGKRFRNAIAGEQFVDSFKQLPELAAAAGHPFGKIDAKAFRTVVSQSDKMGFEDAAVGLGISGASLEKLLTTDSDVAGVDPTRAKEIRGQRAQLEAKIGAFQQRNLVAMLDQLNRADPSMRNSQLFRDFLTTPAGSSMVMAIENQSVNGGFMDWMAGSVSRGGLPNQYSNYTQGYSQATHQADLGYMQTSMMLARGYRNDPIRRMGAVMAGMGLNRGDIVKMGGAIGPMLPSGTAAEERTLEAFAPTRSGYAPRTTLAARQIEAIDNIILNGKFDDPDLERIRKEVAKDWRTYSKQADSIVDSIAGLRDVRQHNIEE